MEAIKSGVQNHRRGCSVTHHPQSDCSHQVLSIIGELGTFDTLEAWEQFLTHSILMPQTILYARTMIALKKEELELDLDVMSGKLPFGGAFIDPPGPFDTLATWEHFLAKLETMSDSFIKRATILDAKRMIAMKKRETSGE
jgi:hypothetical protein